MSNNTKELKKSTYVWSHIGVIIFHVIIGALLVATYYRNMIFGIKSNVLVLVLGILLLVMSLGSLVPILQDYDKIIIE